MWCECEWLLAEVGPELGELPREGVALDAAAERSLRAKLLLSPCTPPSDDEGDDAGCCCSDNDASSDRSERSDMA